MQRTTSAGAGRIGRIGALGVVLGALWIAGAPMPAAAAPGDPGTVSGRVVDGTGAPIAGICVNVDPGGQGATTQVDGGYEIAGVAPGTYSVRFTDCNAAPTFLPRWYLNRDDPSLADTVTVSADPDAGPILGDQTLLAGVAVSGTVTDGAGAPLPGIDVFVNPYDGPGPSTGAVTGPDGAYRTGPLPDGDYRVQIDDPADLYPTQYWQGHFLFSDADRLSLSAAGGTERTGVNATLTLGASITGTVTGDAGPLAGICVNANTPVSGGGWNGVGFAQTAADGTYTISAIPPGMDLRVQFYDCRTTPAYVEQWYSGAADFGSSTSILLSPGEVRSGIDARLTTGIRVAGRVTDEAGNPLADIDVNVNPDGPGQGGFGRTDVSGNYVTSPVVPGRYRVQFRDNAGTWAAEYWDDQATFGGATILELTTADAPQRNGVDAQLDAGGSVSGTVAGTAGVPVPGACISVAIDTANGPDGVGFAQADSGGSYTVGGLPPVPVRVRADDCGAVGPYQSRWWQDAASYAAATPIPLTAGEQRTGVDFELPLAATISGRVTNAAGQAISGICVQATTADAFGALVQTDGSGQYQLILAGGDYTIQFVDCSAQLYTGQTLGPISVGPGQARTGVDALLVPGATATVSGTVRNGDGVAVTGACVVVYLPNQYALFGQVLGDGTFSIPGVPSGTYALAFVGCGVVVGEPTDVVPDPVDPGRTYQAQWWRRVALSLAGTGDGGPDPIAQGATLVTVPPGATLTGFDQCFGCTTPPPPTTSTTTTNATTPTTGAPPTPTNTAAPTGATPTTTNSATTTVAVPTTTSAGQVTVTITDQARRPGTITLTFTSTGAVQAATYTASCTSATADAVTATGPSSPLKLTGVDDRATYSCTISASAADGQVVATSAGVEVGALSTGRLPATGAGSASTAWAAVVITVGGAMILYAVRRCRTDG